MPIHIVIPLSRTAMRISRTCITVIRIERSAWQLRVRLTQDVGQYSWQSHGTLKIQAQRDMP